MSRLLDFYRGQGTDTEGRRLVEILRWDDDELEQVHDFIQWLFPLPEPSQFNPDAPLLTEDDIATFKSEPILRANLQKSFERILMFLGLELKDGQAVEGANFAARIPDVWSFPNHNWLRITRILRCLTLLGLEAEATAFFGWLEKLEKEYTRRTFPISGDTFRYWSGAVNRAE